MKLHALLVAFAVAFAGSAFAASDTKPVSKTTKTTTHKVTKKTTHQRVVRQGRKSASSDHRATRHMMGASSRHMNEMSRTAPDTDLQAGDRQRRIDEAYDKWRSSNPSQ